MRSPTVVNQSRHWFALALLAVYGAIFLYFDGLRFSPIWDEPNFWRATLSFTDGSVPWLERLRNYGTLNTPLPFLIFAAIESTFHAGLFGRRFFNFIFSLVMVSVIGLSGRSGSRTALATLGLVSFPYFLQFSVLFYTDIIGAFFAFAGVWCYQRRRDRLGCLALVLAIAARQFTLSVAAAIFAHELISTVWSEGFRLRTRWIAPFTGLRLYHLLGGVLWRAGHPRDPAQSVKPHPECPTKQLFAGPRRWPLRAGLCRPLLRDSGMALAASQRSLAPAHFREKWPLRVGPTGLVSGISHVSGSRHDPDRGEADAPAPTHHERPVALCPGLPRRHSIQPTQSRHLVGSGARRDDDESLSVGKLYGALASHSLVSRERRAAYDWR